MKKYDIESFEKPQIQNSLRRTLKEIFFENRGYSKSSIEVKKPKYGYKEPLLCKDGHKVKSNFERNVDDWLYENNINHIYEPRIPGDKSYKADFKVGRYYIEVLGMMKLSKYRSNLQKKIDYFSMNVGSGFICFKAEDYKKYKKYINKSITKPAVILLIPNKKKLTKEDINNKLKPILLKLKNQHL